MDRNGDGKPPRPSIALLSPADPSEAAAVIAAVEQFIADTAPAPARKETVNPWQRAALLEGVRSMQAFASPWGEPRTWGERHSRSAGSAMRWWRSHERADRGSFRPC